MQGGSEVLMRAGVVVLLLSALVADTSAHSIDMGQCRTNVPSVEDFQQEAFAGKWYVIELSSTSSKCFTMDFRSTNGGYTVVDSQLLWWGGVVDTDIVSETDHFYTITGDGKMSAKGRGVISFPTASVSVLDTDYVTYAALHECATMLFVRRMEGAILSRTPTLDPDIVSMLKDKLAENGVNVNRLDVIDHNNCPADPDLVVRPSDWLGGSGGEAPAEGEAGAGEGETEATIPAVDTGFVNPDENEVP